MLEDLQTPEKSIKLFNGLNKIKVILRKNIE